MRLFQLSPLTQRRITKFKRIRRGWWSLWILAGVYCLSLGTELLIGNRPLLLKWEGTVSFPAVTNDYYSAKRFGGALDIEADFRELAASSAFREAGGVIVMPPHPYSPLESVVVKGDPPPSRPHRAHPFGTDDRGRDILARVAYGFRISVTFAILVAVSAYAVGITLGSLQGYFGGKVDILGQRLVEIWAALPFLYVVILIAAVLEPSFPLLVGILVLFHWISISRYTRAEVLRERQKDYAVAARASGAGWSRVLFGHVLGNSLTPAITLFPFQLVADIFALTALDFLGFGLPAPTPSWGELFKQGRGNITSWWLIAFPFAALFVTLLLTTFVGEALREAWDPREHRHVVPQESKPSRLRAWLRRLRGGSAPGAPSSTAVPPAGETS